MDNTIVLGLAGLTLLLLTTNLFFMIKSRRTIAGLNKKIAIVSDEKDALFADRVILEEECQRIEPLEQEIEQSKKNQEQLQAEINKLSTEMASEVEKNQISTVELNRRQKEINNLNSEFEALKAKNNELQEAANQLKEKESSIEELNSVVQQNKSTISDLESKIQAEQSNSQEKQGQLDKIKELFA